VTVRVSAEGSRYGLQTLVLDNERIHIVMIPELGGRIWQVTDLATGRDLLWHNPHVAPHRVPFGAVYDDVFFGGWDELFPNDMPERLAGAAYPDHGELWASPWSWQLDNAGTEHVQVSLGFRTPISGCVLTKRLSLDTNAPHLRVSWRIENLTDTDLPFLWKQHLAVPSSAGATIGLGAREMYLDDFGTPRAGGLGTRYTWPYLIDADGRRHDMSRMPDRAARVAEFQYSTELDRGWCAVTSPDGSGIGLAFDRDVFRSCWTFASYGGWRSHEVVILEPCTGYPISVTDGVAAGTHQVLPAGALIETAVTMVVYESLAEVDGLGEETA